MMPKQKPSPKELETVVVKSIGKKLAKLIGKKR